MAKVCPLLLALVALSYAANECTVPSIDNGTPSKTGTVNENEKITVNCNDGYKKTDTEFQCKAGNFKPELKQSDVCQKAPKKDDKKDDKKGDKKGDKKSSAVVVGGTLLPVMTAFAMTAW